ncbi:ribosome biogenesis GTPase Der [Chloroflexota bacterium]
MSKPVVAIVGRPNVGKSTLFNCIAGQHIAIVEDLPGTTRDRVYADISWHERVFVLVDTGGLELTADDNIGRMVKAQVEVAIDQADVIIFLVDIAQGITVPDQEIADVLRCSNKQILLAVNKCDNRARDYESLQFFELVMGDPLPISAHHRMGINDLLDKVTSFLPDDAVEYEQEADLMKVAIVGRPNVGKSMLINAILGEERSIVSGTPGTTRDAVDTVIEHEGQKVVLIDTGGIRKRGRIEKGVEKYSVMRAVRAISRADIAVLVIDVTESLTSQDAHIAGYIRDDYKGMVLVVNKWDLADEVDMEAPEITQEIQSKLKFFPGVPILYTSAKYGEGIENVLKAAQKVYGERTKRYSTPQVNSVIKEALATHSPSTTRGRKLKVLYATQGGVNPPTFVLFVNDKDLLHFSYKRYLENKLRRAFNFTTTPLRLVVKNRSKSDSR